MIKSPVKIALIGAGVWGETHAFLYKESKDVELTAVCDLDQEKAEALAQKFDVPHVFTDHKEMLGRVNVEAVAIVTPDFTHAPLVVDCAEARKDIMLEKPIATTRSDVREIVEAVDRNDIRLMVDLHNRWSPPFATAREKISEGEIGEVVNAYFRLNDKMWVATDMLSWAEQSSVLWFLGSHAIDTLRWLFADEIKRVYAVSHEGILKEKGIDTVDVYQTILEFNNGGIATVENGWITPDSHSNINDIKFNICGSEGMINIDTTNSGVIEFFDNEKQVNPDVIVNHFVHGKAEGFAYKSIQHFVEKLISGEDFLVSVADAARTSLVILAIMESAETGQPVTVDYNLEK